MKYYIGNKEYDLSNDELEEYYLDEGTEASCYKIEDFVMKIHHNYPNNDVLSEEDCKRLINIKTNRIILPDDIVYDEDGNYLGYITKYIKSEKPKIKNLKIGRLLYEFYNLEKEVKQLDEEDLLLDDLNYLNTLFSNGIYLCDPGKYSFVDSSDKKRFLNCFNRDTINYYEVNELLFKLFKFNKKEKQELLSILCRDCEYVTETIENIGYDLDEDAKTYFKRISNR